MVRECAVTNQVNPCGVLTVCATNEQVLNEMMAHWYQLVLLHCHRWLSGWENSESWLVTVVPATQITTGKYALPVLPVADLEIQKGGLHLKTFGLPRPLPACKRLNWNLKATLGLVKHLEISKELIRECVTVPGCCYCMPLLHNHLMDSCSYVQKLTLLAAKGGYTCTP